MSNQTKDVYCEELIVCKKERRGSGLSELSPIRIITQVFDKEGTLIAENDPIYEFLHVKTLQACVKHYCTQNITEPTEDNILCWLKLNNAISK